MVEGGAVIVLVAAIAVAVCIGACWWIDRRVKHEIDEFDEYMRERAGDDTNPHALADWRIANKDRF